MGQKIRETGKGSKFLEYIGQSSNTWNKKGNLGNAFLERSEEEK
jgi:hypothetical protein